MTDIVPRPGNRTLFAAGLILSYSALIGLIDNFVQVIARDGGLWQFHVLRTVMACGILAVLARPMGLRFAPRNRRAVAARSLVHATAMMIYFGGLAFLPVAEVAAGIFTAPIFVLLLSRFAYGRAIGPVRVGAVVAGFCGAVLVLGISPALDLSPGLTLPVIGGAFYGLSNVATREWCPGERAETLLLGFFLALGLFGLAGIAIIAVWQPPAPAGAPGFLLRGLVWPTGPFLFWTLVQAAGSLVAVGLLVRAYQVAEASRVSVFEYAFLPMSAFWTWWLWGGTVAPAAALGMALIAAAGVAIALGGDGRAR